MTLDYLFSMHALRIWPSQESLFVIKHRYVGLYPSCILCVSSSLIIIILSWSSLLSSPPLSLSSSPIHISPLPSFFLSSTSFSFSRVCPRYSYCFLNIFTLFPTIGTSRMVSSSSFKWCVALSLTFDITCRPN